MRFTRPKPLHSLARVAVLILACASSALPQSRTIRLVNPYPPGGTGDIIARIVTEQIGRTQNVSFVVEDRPGGGSVVGADVVARAVPDGNTLLLNTSAVLINAHLRKLNFDALASFEPICNVTQSPQLIFVNSTSPYRSVADLVAAARDNHADLTLATTGPFSAAHIGFERFKQIAHVSITHVPFPGNAPTVNAVLGGHVSAGIANYADLVGHFAAEQAAPDCSDDAHSCGAIA
jgi:tripartite-type tricarboxylate transporter receptor subunit TctC